MLIPHLEALDKSTLEESLRLDALSRLFILDTPPEASCDEITQLAATLFPSCNAMLTFVDENRVWVKASAREVVHSVPRHLTLCAIAVEKEGCTVILDVKADHVRPASRNCRMQVR